MNNIHILDLAEYKQPIIKESKRDNWVEIGSDNNYFQFLIDRYKNSATNNAVINNICRLIYGRGLSALDGSKKVEDFARLITLFSKDDIRNMVMDRKLLGQFAIQVHYNKQRQVVKAYHIPVHLLRAEKCNKDGDIEGYYYSNDWTDIKKYKPERYDAFGFGSSEIEILYSKPYSVGLKYYSLVDYVGCLPYTVLEQEVSEYLINEVQNGFSGTKVVNFSNGIPSEEEQGMISSKVLNKLTGSRGQKVIVSFNNNAETKTTVDDIPLNDAPNHYNYLSDESRNKILVGHNVTSPLLFGIATATGFSSNADELKNSAILFDNMVIKPFQEELIDAFDKILAVNGISLKLFFRDLQPLDGSGNLTTNNDARKTVEAINSLSPLVANKVLESMTVNEIRSLVGLNKEKGGEDLPVDVAMSSQEISKYGHDLPSNWVLIDEFDDDNSDEDTEQLNDQKLSLVDKVVNLVKTGVARPRSGSEQDQKIKEIKYYTRYRYTGLVRENTRDFCKAMLQANKLYRKEDITQMSSDAVNKGWGPEGVDNYDIFKYKGGGDCRHVWRREVYASIEGGNVDVTSPNARQIATSTAEKRGYKIRNPFEVNVQPKNLPYNGFLPSNKKFQ